MADLDLTRYDGHTPGPWLDYRQGGDWWLAFGVRNGCPRRNVYRCPVDMTDADRALCVDAPLLLAEVNRLRAESERLRDCLAVLRLTAREYLAVSVPECAETGADLGREDWTPGYRAKYEALEQLAKESTR